MASDLVVSSFAALGGVRQVTLTALAEPPDGKACLPYMQPAKYEFWSATSSSGANAAKIGEAPIGVFTHTGLLVRTTRWYRARAIDAQGEPSEFSEWKSATTTTTGTGSIDTDELAAGAVTEAKIENAAISRAKIRDAAIGSAQIDNLAVTSAKIGIAAVETAHIGNLAVKNAQIDNLTIGTGKVQYNATYEMSVSGQGGSVSPGNIMQGQGIYVRRGAVSIDVSTFIDKPSDASSNNGYLRVQLRRNGQQITSRRIFYDDNFAIAFAFTHADYGVGENSTPYYEAYLETLSGPGNFRAIDTVIRCINFRG
ncbi:MAG: hypothetical protein K0R85_254 [Devosia sp.]|jgi:hypothetical protein|nr:hypothetical protein [Devosia sp.]